MEYKRLVLEIEADPASNIRKVQEELGYLPDKYLLCLARMEDGDYALAVAKEYLHLTDEVGRYRIDEYLAPDNEIVTFWGVRPGLDSTHFCDNLEDAKMCALLFELIGYADARVVTDTENGGIVYKSGEIPVAV